MTKNIEKFMPEAINYVEYRKAGLGTGNTPEATSEITFGNAALMIVNAQNEYLDGALKIPRIEPAVQQISRLLERARNNDTPIMYLQHVDCPGGLFDPVGRGGQFIDTIAPDNHEHIVQKTTSNGFAATNLAEQLDHIGRKKLIIAGFMTHMCVSFTARAAVELGYQTSVVTSACAATLLRNAHATHTEERDVHALAQTVLADNGVWLFDETSQIDD